MSAKVMRYKGSNTASLSDLTPNKLYQLNFDVTDIDETISIIDEVNETIYLDHDYLRYFEEVQNPLLNSEIYNLKVYVGNEINNQMKFLNLEKDKIYQINYYNSKFSNDFTGYIITDQGQKINLTAEDMKEFKKFDENTIFNLNRSLEKIDYLNDQIKIKDEHNKELEHIRNFLEVEEDEDLKEAIAKLKDDNIVTDNILLDKEKLIDDLYVKIEKLHKVIKSLIDLV